MKRFLLILLLVFVLLPTVTFAESAANERARLQKIQKELKDKKVKLQATKKKEQKSLSQLVEIKGKLKQAKRQLNRATNKISSNEQSLRSLRTELKETDLVLKQKTAKLFHRIREIYKNSSVNYLDLIFTSKNMSDFINRSYFFSRLVENDVGLINVVADKFREASGKKKKLEGITIEIKSLANTIKKKKQEISREQQKEQQVYSGLKERRKDYENRIAKLERSSEELTSVIRSKVAQNVKTKRTGRGSGSFDWPLRGRITSRYGYRRHPYWGGRHFHTGLDIAAPYGRPIKAADGGRVILARWWDGYGKAVVISHGNDKSTVYGHMSRIYVSNDSTVSKGQIIGLVGSTGYSTGPHLHFEVRKSGKHRNPIKYLP